MLVDPQNHITRLCAQGMQWEGEGKPGEASACFQQAWAQAATDLEKAVAAHYLARHQISVADKLQWDEIALQFALNIPGEEIKELYPSLYVNVAKGYEDINDFAHALHHYQAALSYIPFLRDDGYGAMIIAGIHNGIQRLSTNGTAI